MPPGCSTCSARTTGTAPAKPAAPSASSRPPIPEPPLLLLLLPSSSSWLASLLRDASVMISRGWAARSTRATCATGQLGSSGRKAALAGAWRMARVRVRVCARTHEHVPCRAGLRRAQVRPRAACALPAPTLQPAPPACTGCSSATGACAAPRGAARRRMRCPPGAAAGAHAVRPGGSARTGGGAHTEQCTRQATLRLGCLPAAAGGQRARALRPARPRTAGHPGSAAARQPRGPTAASTRRVRRRRAYGVRTQPPKHVMEIVCSERTDALAGAPCGPQHTAPACPSGPAGLRAPWGACASWAFCGTTCCLACRALPPPTTTSRSRRCQRPSLQRHPRHRSSSQRWVGGARARGGAAAFAPPSQPAHPPNRLQASSSVPYSVVAGLAGAGVAETAYLTWVGGAGRARVAAAPAPRGMDVLHAAARGAQAAEGAVRDAACARARACTPCTRSPIAA